MTIFDFVVLALIAASVVAGALRGLVRAAITGLALILGIIFAARGYAMAGALLRALGVVDAPDVASAAGFLLIVGFAFIIGLVAGGLVRGGLRRTRLEWFDHALGAAFGLVRGLAVCSVIYLGLVAFPVRLSAVAEARTAPILARGAKVLAICTSSDVRARFITEYRRLTA